MAILLKNWQGCQLKIQGGRIMRINQNISAMNTYSRLTSANSKKAGSLAKLSSGLRINRAGDDAAGLAISEKMRGQVGGLKQSVRNAQDGISLIQTAEGALTETHSILGRMRELAVQSSNDTNTLTDRKEIQKEMDELATEITRISKNTEFNTKGLLDGSLEEGKESLTFHIGANSDQNLKLNIENMGAEALKVAGLGKDAVLAEAAVLETGTIDSSILSTDFTSNNAGPITVNGQTVQLTEVNKLDGSSTAITSAAFASALNTDIAAVFDGSAHDGLTFTVADNASNDGITITSSVSGGDSLVEISGGSTLGINGTDEGVAAADAVAAGTGGIDVSTQEAADAAITTINDAIETVSAERSKLGATQNRLDHTINNLTATAENLSEAESRIRDVDMAEEMMSFTKNNILSQAATSMLAQANQMPQSVLQLLQ